jgi:SNF2 family DNA or RNA helicase
MTSTALWEHQIKGVEKLLPLNAGALLMDMGTGKTLASIELLNRWNINRVLIVCPKAVCQIWPREFTKHSDQWDVILLNNGSVADKSKKLNWNGKKKAIIINYESAWRNPVATWLIENPPECIIADESHKIKSPGGRASRFMSKLGRLVKKRLLLTGTIMSHGPLDVYAQMRFANPSIFGYSFVRFRSRYAQMGGFQQHEVVGFQNLEELHEKLYSVSYRVRADEVLSLPDTLDETLTFDLSPRARKIYRDLEKDLVANIQGGEITAANAMVKLIRLQQLTGGWLSPDDSTNPPEQVDTGKAEVLKELIEGMGQEQVVVFCRFHRDLDSIHAVCKSLGVASAELSGRKNELRTWENWKAQVLATQLQSGGLGIDLSQARYCVYYSHGWSLGDYQQSRARVHRPGQKRNVTYYHLCAAKTVDVKVMKALEKRQDLVRFVVDDLRGQ